jgi:hypothetical protein
MAERAWGCQAIFPDQAVGRLASKSPMRRLAFHLGARQRDRVDQAHPAQDKGAGSRHAACREEKLPDCSRRDIAVFQWANPSVTGAEAAQRTLPALCRP